MEFGPAPLAVDPKMCRQAQPVFISHLFPCLTPFHQAPYGGALLLLPSPCRSCRPCVICKGSGSVISFPTRARPPMHLLYLALLPGSIDNSAQFARSSATGSSGKNEIFPPH